eukprot:jgi/Botrbrau1/3415/Bobra.0337s0048.1
MVLSQRGGRAVKVQLPFKQAGQTPEEAAAEVAAREARRERNRLRLQQMAHDRRAQELERRHEAVQYFKGIAELYDMASSLAAAQDILAQADLPDLAALHEAMASAEAALANFGQRKRKKTAEPNEATPGPTTAFPKQEAGDVSGSAPLPQASDEGYQEDVGETALEDDDREDEEYLQDPDAYLEKLKSKHRLVAHRVEQRRIRRLKKLGVTGHAEDRRGIGRRERMRLIASATANPDKEDDFGARDDDWDVYREMERPRESDSEAEVADEEEYARTAEQLKKLGSAQFVVSLDPGLAAARPEGPEAKPDPSAAPARKLTEEDFQVTLSLARVQIPELLLQPSALLGLDQAGIWELVTLVLDRLGSPRGRRVRPGACS